MHRVRGTWLAVLAGLLLVTGCGGCGEETAATSTPDPPPIPAAPDEPAPTPSTPAPPKKPPKRPKKPPIKKSPIKKPPAEPQNSDVEDAVEKLKRLGAIVDRPKRADGTYEPVRGVFLANNNRNTREALQYVTKLPTIKLLHVTGGSVTDADMFYLLELKNLESLKIKDNKKITSVGLAYLHGKDKLKYLNLINTRVDDSGMKYLSGLKNLRTLRLGGTKVSRAAFAKLKEQHPKLDIR